MSLLLKDARLIDGISLEAHEHVDVWIQDGYIREMGPKLSQRGKDAQIIDCALHCLLPGLIDCHVHLCLDGSTQSVENLTSETEATTLLKMVHHARQTLRRGVTTVRDLGSKGFLSLALRDAVERGWIPGPRIVASGPVITTPGGHGHFIGIEAKGEEATRRATRQNVQASVDVIKVMATGGRLTPGSKLDEPQFSDDELRVIVEECKGHGLKVATHALGLAGIRQVIPLGVTSIEHGSYMDEEAMVSMKEKDICWVPTNIPAKVLLEGPASTNFAPAELEGAWRNWRARRPAVQRGIELGVPFAAGSDAGVTCMEHGRVAWEVELFAELGMSPMEAIWTATRRAAELLDKGNEIGTIEPGKLADLILVPGDPIQDLRVLSHPMCVIKEGKIVS